MRNIIALPITPALFAPFGILLSTDGLRAEHRHNAPQSQTCIETLWAPAQPGHCDIQRMERHGFSTQTFFPLDVSRYLVVVCPGGDGDRPDTARALAFVVDGRMALQYHRGTWHCNMAALDRPGLFANLVQKNHGEDDCTVITVPPFRVTLPS
jgi:ureidoglycolate lyase